MNFSGRLAADRASFALSRRSAPPWRMMMTPRLAILQPYQMRHLDGSNKDGLANAREINATAPVKGTTRMANDRRRGSFVDGRYPFCGPEKRQRGCRWLGSSSARWNVAADAVLSMMHGVIGNGTRRKCYGRDRRQRNVGRSSFLTCVGGVLMTSMWWEASTGPTQ